MKELIIVGAGGFGREALYIAQRINNLRLQWRIKGFIDDNLHALRNVKCNFEVIGTIKDWKPSANEVFALGISTPKVKETIATILKEKGARFVNLICPSAIIDDFTEIGEGCVINAMTFIGDNTKIGNFVHVASALIGQDSILGDFSTITGYANVATAKIGKRVFIGSHSVILNNRKIGDDAFICAGSIVFSHIKNNIKVIGNPAKKADF